MKQKVYNTYKKSSSGIFDFPQSTVLCNRNIVVIGELAKSCKLKRLSQLVNLFPVKFMDILKSEEQRKVLIMYQPKKFTET